MANLLPCPHCQGNACIRPYCVSCLKCGLSGPIKVKQHEAIDAWNSLPRAPMSALVGRGVGMKWIPHSRAKWHQQKLPKEYRPVLVQMSDGAAAPRPGVADAVVVGYLKFAAGDKRSPYLVTVGGGMGRDPVAWCDCLPEGVEVEDYFAIPPREVVKNPYISAQGPEVRPGPLQAAQLLAGHLRTKEE